MIKRLALSALAVLVAAIATLLGLALSRPDTYRVEREIEIAAAPALIFSNLDNFHRWALWSPWERQDAHKTYDGPPSSVGASYAWEGKDAGIGSMTVVERKPPEKLSIRLTFVKPVQEANELSFALTPLPAATRVRWSMSGPTRFAARLLGVFADVEPLIGRDLETGLARLKELSETNKTH